MIESLTKEQEERLPEFRDKWLKIGLSCEPLDFEKAKNAAIRAYREAGLDPPGMFFRFRSPVEAAYADTLIQSLLTKRGADQVKDQVKDQVWDQVRAQVRDQAWAQVKDQVWDQVWAQVGDQVWDQVGAQVKDQVRDQVGAQVRDQVWAQAWDQAWAQVRDQVGAQVGAQAWDQVWGQAWDQVWGQVWVQVGAQVWGSHDAGWLSLYDFFHLAGVKEVSRLAPLMDLAQCCGWWAPRRGYVIFQDRHCELYRDPENRIHNENGPAVLYRDGFAVYAIHGARVPKELIEDPAWLTVDRIELEENREVRRIMVDRYGYDRYLRESGAQKVHSDDWGTLWRKDQKGDEPICMVEVLNSTPEPDGSIKTYWLRVPPEMQRAKQAIAWTFGKEEEEYKPAIQS